MFDCNDVSRETEDRWAMSELAADEKWNCLDSAIARAYSDGDGLEDFESWIEYFYEKHNDHKLTDHFNLSVDVKGLQIIVNGECWIKLKLIDPESNRGFDFDYDN
jgi:hypothetical protein